MCVDIIDVVSKMDRKVLSIKLTNTTCVKAYCYRKLLTGGNGERLMLIQCSL